METTQELLNSGGFTQSFLVGEHIAQNLDIYNQGEYQGGQLSLLNLQLVKRHPYTCKILPNLTLGENLDQTTHEISLVAQNYNVGFILDLTTRYHGLNVEKLKILQERSHNKVKFLYGYTPKENYIVKSLVVENLQEKLKQEVEFDMKHGQLKVVPTFIGEIIITDLKDTYQRTLLEVCYQYQKTTINGELICPIFINLGRNYKQLLPQLIEFFGSTQGQGIVYLLTDIINDNLEVANEVKHLFQNTKSHILLTIFNHEISLKFGQLSSETLNLPQYEENTFKFKKLLDILFAQGYQNRILLSTGVTFKTHLTQFGGLGYQAIFDEVLNTFPSSIIQQIMIQNPAKLLSWRPKQVAEPEKATPKWDCRFCKGKFEETHQKFEKMDFNYCSMKCLSSHRQAGFK